MTSRLPSGMLNRMLLLFWICCVGAASLPTHVGATTLELSAVESQYFCREVDGPGIVTIHVLLDFNLGTTAARFRIQASPEVTWTYLSETPSFPTFLGNTQTGITICYDQCVMDPGAHLVSIKYMAYGTSTACTGGVFIAPHPDAETVDVMNCDGSSSAAFTRSLVLGCECPSSYQYPGTAHVFDCPPLATKITTWGGVKALYQD